MIKTMINPYRDQDPHAGFEEREVDAVAELGLWRRALLGRVALLAALAGATITVPGFLLVSALQFRAAGVAWLWLSVALAAAAPFLAMMIAAIWFARPYVTRKTPAKLASLAERHRVPVERLQSLAKLAL
jgi:hypothetical protein